MVKNFLALSIFLAAPFLSSCHSSSGGSSQPGHAPASVSSCQFVKDGWGPTGNVPLKAEKVVTGLEVPWALAFLPDGDWLVTERPGRVRLVHAGKLQTQPVATIQVGEGGEGGLLGLALHPQFSSNRYFYVYYTVSKDGTNVNRVQRYVLSQDHQIATADRVIIDDISAGTFHNGGRIHFGPDGKLYIATGDARNPDSAQDPASPNGKILRLDPEGQIPSDNPKSGSAVYASGIRNLEAFDWARPDLLIIADNGPTGELDLTGLDRVALIGAGSNLGWPVTSGCGSGPGFVTPALSWNTPAPPGGGVIYHGSAIPEFNGNFIVGMLGRGDGEAHQLHRIVFDPASQAVTSHEVYLKDQFGRLRDVVQGPDGALYVTTSNCDSRGTCPFDGDAILKIMRGSSS